MAFSLTVKKMGGKEERLYNLIKETFLLLEDGDRQLFGLYDLTVPRFYALFHIGNEPGISSSRLSERMLCDKSNVTRIVKGLEAEGYIVRKPHETDGRTLRLFLTEPGEMLRRQVVDAHTTYNQARLHYISKIEQDGLLQGLAKLNEHLLAALYPPEPHSHTNKN